MDNALHGITASTSARENWPSSAVDPARLAAHSGLDMSAQNTRFWLDTLPAKKASCRRPVGLANAYRTRRTTSGISHIMAAVTVGLAASAKTLWLFNTATVPTNSPTTALAA